MAIQEINCNVESCKFNNHNYKCTLDSIVVGAEKNSVTDKCDTECASFESQI